MSSVLFFRSPLSNVREIHVARSSAASGCIRLWPDPQIGTIGDNLIAEAMELIKESDSPNNIDDLSMV